MKKYRIVFTIIFLALVGAGIWYFFYRKKEQKIFVITEKPQFGYISKSVTATGNIQPVDTVTIGSQVSGTIANIYTDFNARVTKGQLLAQLDKSLFNAQVDQYKANLEVAKATMVYQKSNFDRQSLLYNTGAISKADYETAQDQYLTAKATAASVHAQLNAAEKNLSYTSIHSPVNGVVLLRNISVGQTVAASFNTPTLFIIAKDITKMQVQAAVDEADIGDVKDSQRVMFYVDAYPDNTFYGKVNQIRLEPSISSNVVTYTTIVTTSNTDLKLKPGMTANIFIYTKEVNHAMLISSRALKFKPDASLANQYKLLALPPETKPRQNANTSSDHAKAGISKHSSDNSADGNAVKASLAFVWVQYGDSMVEKQIHTGLNDDTHVEVIDGLEATDSVIISASQAQVNAASANAAPPKSPFMPTRQATPPKSKASSSGSRP